MDYRIFDDDRNIVQGYQGDVWAMLKKFLSKNPGWWKRLIEVAKQKSKTSSIPSKKVLSDKDIIEDWVRVLWEENTDQSVMRKTIQFRSPNGFRGCLGPIHGYVPAN